MYLNQLGDCAVSRQLDPDRQDFCLLFHSNSYAPFQYTPEGKEVMQRLWQETLTEFSFVDMDGIIKSL